MTTLRPAASRRTGLRASRRAAVPLVALCVAGALALAGCSSSGNSAASSAAPSKAAPASSAAASSAPSPAAGTSVTAVETEFKIALSRSSFSAGKYTFTAANHGHLSHNLILMKGSAPVGQTPGLVSPGKSASFTVTLAAGTYDLFCGVPGHKDAGMNTVIHVS